MSFEDSAHPIKIIPHENFEGLLDAFCEEIQKAPPSPLPRPVVTPSIFFKDYLQVAIAKKMGVCMGMEFLASSTFISRIIERSSDSPWLKEHLTWSILPHAEDYAKHLGLDSKDASLRDLFAISSLLANQLDRYAHSRPEMIRKWNKGESFLENKNSDEGWQKTLWTHLKTFIGEQSIHPAVGLEQLRKNRDFLKATKEAFPLVTLFGTGILDPLLVEVLLLLHKAGTDLTLHMLLPTLDYLGDLKNRKESPTLQRLRDNPEEQDLQAAHPLLTSMGRHAIGSFCLLQELDENMSYWPTPLSSDKNPFPSKPTLLAQLQQDIRHLQQPTRWESDIKEDLSIRVHSCFGPRREIEVLRDEILRAFRDIPDLQPEDIHIVTPSLEDYAPLVSTVLEQTLTYSEKTLSGDPPLKVRVTEWVKGEQKPIIGATLALLELAHTGRYEASRILELLHFDPISHALGMEENQEEGIDSLRSLIRCSGLTQGLGEEDAPAPVGSWPFANDRLVAGLWMGKEERARYVDHSFIFPITQELGSKETLIRLFTEWLAKLERTMREWSRPAPPRHWKERLQNALTDLLGCQDGEDSFLRPHLAFLASLSCEKEIDAGTMLDWLDTASDDTRRHTLISGKITFGRFRQLQNIPCKVLIMVGMQDTAFPRSNRLPAWDLLQADPRVWDRNLRIEDRQFFLDALLAPSDRLIITGSTRNIRTNKNEPFSSCVDELLRVLKNMLVSRDDAVLIEHPLQPFSADYFQSSPPHSLPRSFSKNYAQMADEILKNKNQPKHHPFWDGSEETLLPSISEDLEISVQELIDFWKDPARAYVKAQRISLRKEEESDEDLNRLPLSPDFLAQWKIENAILEEMLSENCDLEFVKERLKADRLLPKEHLGDDLWEVKLKEILPLAEEIKEHTGDWQTIDLQIPLASATIRLTGDIRLTKHKDQFLFYQVNEPKKAKHLIAPWIKVLCASHKRDRLPTRYLYPTPLQPSAKNHYAPLTYSDQEIESILSYLVEGYLQGQQRPLCYAPSTSEEFAKEEKKNKDASSVSSLRSLEKAKTKSWESNGFDGRCEGESDAARLAWRDRDPFMHPDDWMTWLKPLAYPLLQWMEKKK